MHYVLFTRFSTLEAHRVQNVNNRITKLSKIVPAKKRPPLDALMRAFYSGVKPQWYPNGIHRII